MRRSLLLALLLASCSPLHALPNPLITSADEIERLVAPQEPAKPFSAETRVEFYGQGKARKGKLFIMGEPPDRLRIELLSFTDDLISLIVVGPEGFAWFERGKPDCYRGPLCAAPIVARFPMVSKPEILLPLLLGRIPLLRPADRQGVEFDRREGVYRLSIWQGTLLETVDIDPDSKRPLRLQVSRKGEVELDVTFSGQVRAGQPPIPKEIRLLSSPEDADLSIQYRDFDFEKGFTGDPFTFVCPQGTAVHLLDCPPEAP